MRILKKGNPAALRPAARFSCRSCGCIFEAECGEYETRPDYRNGKYNAATCPCCGRVVTDGVPVYYGEANGGMRNG